MGLRGPPKGYQPAKPVKPGRPKGARNKRTKAVEEAISSAGGSPLEFLLAIMQSDNAHPRDRTQAAIAAAPYVHAKLSSTEVKLPERIVAEIRVTLRKA